MSFAMREKQASRMRLCCNKISSERLSVLRWFIKVITLKGITGHLLRTDISCRLILLVGISVLSTSDYHEMHIGVVIVRAYSRLEYTVDNISSKKKTPFSEYKI